ncbi:hypothetical protein BLNAU_9527 [Blattamonas nauphoetae]|uniref:Uncharacterized protein n=1 Tax=Blattamonas nauphoetae TaxID=2049346 RepID=A0ABQ9XVI1_9EUKA|nr:hypothetical protein BLNAU_9527 [Blattamonas nauphoetae]
MNNVIQSPTKKEITPPLSPTQKRVKTRRMRQVQLPECPEDVIKNLHRYPLLVWYDPTSPNDSDDSLLERENMKPLTSLVASKCDVGEEIKYQDLIEWFVCAVIGLNSKASQCDGSFWFDWDDVVVDGFGTARINLSASRSDSSPPHSPQSFSDCITHLSLLFLVLIDQLSKSNCLPPHIEDTSRRNEISSLLRHLLHHLVNIGHLVPACDPSEFETVLTDITNAAPKHLSDDLDLYHNFLWMATPAYLAVNFLEIEGLANHVNRLTDSNFDYDSPKFTAFFRLIEPALVEVSKQFEPELFEEARRISSWKDFLQKVAGGEEVENDTSFLKLPFFQPTLLSLQAKFQQLASSLDGSDDAHYNSSLRTHSSSSHFKHESIQLLNILHTLLTSPLSPSLIEHSPSDSFSKLATRFQPDNIDPAERFRPSLFDEVDDVELARSLIRCRSVCDLVGVEKCIVDTPEFFDRTVSVLGSSDPFLREAAFSLFRDLIDTSCVIHLMPHLWDRLHSAFRDGRLEEQDALLTISTKWIVSHVGGSLPPFPVTQFDWDGLISADLSEIHLFLFSLLLIMQLRHRLIEDQIGKAKATVIILSFEHHQHAVSRIESFFSDTKNLEVISESSPVLISYNLLISLLLKRRFHSSLTTYLTQHPEFDGRVLLFQEFKFHLLCHTSLDTNQPYQPPLDLLFERALRLHPLNFFLSPQFPSIDIPSSLLDTSLCGFHTLCRRGVHLSLMDAEYVRRGNHVINSLWLFSTPLISDTFDLFLYFPAPCIVRFFLPILSSPSNPSSLVDPLKVMMAILIHTTAPFGDCFSVRELYRSVGPLNIEREVSSLVSFVTSRCESLEWLNIPTGFGSALAHSNTRDSIDHSENQDHSSVSTLPTRIPGFLSKQVHDTSGGICAVGTLFRDLNHSKAQLASVNHRALRTCCKAMFSPIPVEASVMLEYVKRVVSLSSVESVMQMLRFEMLDIVIRVVSESSFLEDYENGICVIGIVLRSICSFGKKKEMVDHDFSRLLSQTGLTFSTDCFPFLNWVEDQRVSEHEQAVIFRSLVATMKVQPAPDDSLETKFVTFLESVDPDDEESADAFLNRIASFSDQSVTDFIQSIVTLLSTSSEAITTSTMKMLHRLLQNCSNDILIALVKADLISQLIVTLDPQSVSLSDFEHMHTALISIIECSLWLSPLDSLAQLKTKDGDEHQTVPETLFQQIMRPSEKYLTHLCVNRNSILDNEKYKDFLILLARILLKTYPSSQPTMETVLMMRIVLTVPSCLSFFDGESSVWGFLDIFVNSRWERHESGDVGQKWKKMDRMLRTEGMEDVMETKLRNDEEAFYGREIIASSITLNNEMGMNVPEQE